MQGNHILQATSSMDAWLSYLKSIHNKNIDMSLKRISKVALRLDILKPAPFVFTVTGTNGKGTTCRILETILIAAGYTVGVYSSPHLIHYTERVRIHNSELPELAHTTSFAIINAVRKDISLTYFEFSTLSALWLFKQAGLNVIILEVGMGGRLDATNIVDADVSIITNIALDHTSWLGIERESIGREKAGIFRNGRPAIIGETNIPKTVIKIAKKKNVLLFRYGIDWQYVVNNNHWYFEDIYGKLSNLPYSAVSQLNAATALAALRISGLKINEQAIHKGIANAILPGRFQIFNKTSPRIVLDVAHNPHAATYLFNQLKNLSNIENGKLLAVIGMLCDKDIFGTLACMKKIVNHWYCASLNETRGASATQLMTYLNKDNSYAKSEAYTSVAQAWYAAMNAAKPEDTVLVFGSFYTVSHVMRVMEAMKIVKINNK